MTSPKRREAEIALKAAFDEVEHKELERNLKGLLMGNQVKAIMARRDALLQYMRKSVAERGEAAVLF